MHLSLGLITCACFSSRLKTAILFMLSISKFQGAHVQYCFSTSRVWSVQQRDALYVQIFMSRERPCVTCLSLSNNKVGCVIGRNGLRWAFNLISMMKEMDERPWWTKGNWTTISICAAGWHSIPPSTTTLIPTYRLHNASYPVSGVFLLTMFVL